MDNYQGDLTDIIRASYGRCSTGTCSSSEAAPQFSSSDPLNFSSLNFGDPFSHTRDPFLYEPHNYMPGSAYFNSASCGALEEETACFGGVIGSGDYTCVLAQKNIIDEDDKRRPMIQISPVMIDALSRVVKPSSAVVSSGNNKPSIHHCLVDNTQVQIQSPRYPPFKRRKSQAKKSICVPAAAAPNSRQSGEVVPSDLWAWRKYGQKPIKGSPYPRGYYRCSSSKGCPARKQVERSRTDPNMLVITYASEHNHPWPTHRAASSRSQPSDTNNNNNVAVSKKQGHEEEESNSESDVSPIIVIDSNSSSAYNSASVKEEKQQLEMEDGEFGEGLSHKMKCNQLDHDLFAELGEIEAHSLNLFSRFHLFDWTGDNSTKYHIV